MSDAVEIVIFEEPLFGIAVKTEIKGLSKAFMQVMLDHVTKLDRGRIDPFQLQTWRDYEGMPVVMLPYGDELMIYVVEQAGSDESLWRDVIVARCNLHFSN